MGKGKQFRNKFLSLLPGILVAAFVLAGPLSAFAAINYTVIDPPGSALSTTGQTSNSISISVAFIDKKCGSGGASGAYNATFTWEWSPNGVDSWTSDPTPGGAAASPYTDTITGLSAGTTYYIRVLISDPEGTDDNQLCDGAYPASIYTNTISVATSGNNGTTTGSLSSPSQTTTTADLQATYTYDDNQDNSVSFQYEYPATVWNAILGATVNRGTRTWSATATGLTPNTAYNFRATFTDAGGVSGTNPLTGAWSTPEACDPVVNDCADCHAMPPSAGSHQIGGHKGGGTRADCAVCHIRYSPLTNVTSTIRWKTGHTNRILDAYTSNKVGNSLFSAPYDKGIKGGYYKGHRNATSLWDGGTPNANNVCSATYCHGAGNSPVWGVGSTNCTSCHAQPPAAGKHATHSQGYAGYANKSVAGAYDFGCYKCHDQGSVGHASGPLSGNQAAGVAFDNRTSPKNASASYAAGALAGTDGTLNWSNGACSSLYCHSDGTGTYVNPTWNGTLAGNCTGCHKGDKTSGNILTSGKHTGHINNADANLATFECKRCHDDTVSANRSLSNRALHVNEMKDVNFQALASYTGFYVSGSKTCRNAYCHSSGQGTPNYRNITWNDAAITSCGACHGADAAFTAPYGEPNYTNASTATMNAFNSHSSHVAAAADCAKCHGNTVDGGQAIVATGKHLDGFRNVSFTKGGSYNASIKRCNNTDCHGTNVMRWGGRLPASCQSCHSDQGAGTNGSHGMTGVHDKHINIYGFACEECHATKNASLNTVHAGGDVSLKHAAQVFFNTSATVWTNIQYGGGGATLKYHQLDSAFGQSGIAPLYRPWTTATASSDPVSPNRKWTEGRCENIWCHSNAKPMGRAITYQRFANWSASETTACTSCHGFTGTFGNITLSYAHKKHAGSDRYNFTCGECHNDTVASGNSPVSSYAKHVNASKDVKFDGTNPGGSYTSPNCSSLACHGNGTGSTGSYAWNGAATTCTSCHAYSAIGGASSKHDEHIAQGNLGNFKCSACHTRTVQTNNTTINYAGGLHVNIAKDVYFKAMGTYTGFYTASRTCRNNYCHSSGQATPSFRTAADWASATAYGCKECHGADSAFIATYGEPNYTNVSTTTGNTFNSHSSHVTAAADCAKCHNQTADSSQAILATGKHLDLARDVSFAKGGTYNTTLKRCSSTDCHGTTQMRWGGSLPKSCQSCHSDQGAGTYANHSSMGKHAKHVSTYGYSCETCHATNNYGIGLNAEHTGGDVSSKHAAQVYFNVSATVWTDSTYGGGGATLKYRQMDSAFGQTGIAPLYRPATTMTALSDPLNTNRKWTQGRCENIWCHSNAKPMGRAITYAKYANWSTAETTTCSSCHGFTGTFANITLSYAHKKHAGSDRYNYTCSECHSDTVASGNSPVSSYAKHADASKDVKFDGTNPGGGYTNPNCSNLACHGNGTGSTGSYAWNGAATTCTSCHAYSAIGGASSKHDEHIAQGNLGNFKCSACHTRTVQTNNTAINYAGGLHVNIAKDVYFKAMGTYTGFYVSGSRTCRNNYCHSSGQATPAFRTAADWASATAYGCASCHGADTAFTAAAGEPNYANVSTSTRNTFNSHSSHVAAASDCIKCHNQTVDAAGAIIASSKHIDAARTVSFQLGGTYDSVNKRCSSTDTGCHGSTTMRWGGAGSCQDCHQVTTAETDNFVYGDATKATINFHEYTAVGHGKKGTYRYTGRPGANLACTSCHTAAVAHGSGTNPFRLTNADVNALCLSCHTEGNHDFAHVGQGTWNWTPKCVDCHDPHGDSGGVTTAEKNGAMVQSKVAYTGSDAYGKPNGTPEAVDFPANYVRARALASAPYYNWSSFVWNSGANKGVCRVCHTEATTTYFTRTVYSSHEAGSSCVTCHTHSSGFQQPSCNSCHGYPPSTSDGKTDNAGAVGAHDKHVTVLGMSCSECHKSNNHNQMGASSGYSGALTPGFVNMSVTSTYRFKGSLPHYNGTPGAWSPAKTCGNVNCHYGQSKNWDCQ